MDYFKLLPDEDLLEIFSWLHPKDIISLSQTCRKLKSISIDDKLWTQVCFNEFGLNIPSANGFARRFYKNVLFTHGKSIGLWAKIIDQPTGDYYGCLIQISYADGKLIGAEIQPPKIPHLTQPVRYKTVFSISIDETEDQSSVVCCVNPSRPHLCELVLSNEQNSLLVRCSESAFSGKEHDIDDDPSALEDYLLHHLDVEVDGLNEIDVFGLDSKFFHSSGYESYFSRLQLPAAAKFPVPIKPGIFKGKGVWDIQFLMLSYEDENTAIGRKITGDVEVSAGENAFKADLRACLYFRDDESQSIERLVKMKPVVSVPNWIELPKPQPFVIPQVGDYSVPASPNECLSRFHGVLCGDYCDPQRGHWIVFNENLFGFLGLEQHGNSDWNLYHRVQELQATNSQP